MLPLHILKKQQFLKWSRTQNPTLKLTKSNQIQMQKQDTSAIASILKF